MLSPKLWLGAPASCLKENDVHLGLPPLLDTLKYISKYSRILRLFSKTKTMEVWGESLVI